MTHAWLTHVMPGLFVVCVAAIVLLLEAAEAALMALPAARVEGALAYATGLVARGLEAWQRRPQLQRLTLATLKALMWLALLMGTQLLGFSSLPSDPSLGGPLLPHLLLVALVLLGALGLQIGGLTLGRAYPMALGPMTLALCAPVANVLLGAAYVLGYLPSKRLKQRLLVLTHDPSVDGSMHTGHHANEGLFWTPDAVVACRDKAHQERLGERGHDLLASIATFSDTLIREIMVPRTAVVSVARTASHADICAQVLAAGHSRLPVYDETIDHIIGLLHVKDLFAFELKGEEAVANFDLTSLLRPVFYVPEVMHISALLHEFQRRKTHMAIVVDEYGGTAGVVTLEDIIEEIVGEIQDEYDVEEKQFRRLPDGKILADGRVNLWDLEKPLGVLFPPDGDYETLAGFLMAQLGSMPRQGTVLRWGPLKFSVKEADERRIAMVEIDHVIIRDT